MKYIYINPVVDSMYDQKDLDEFLLDHGYHRVFHKENWGKVVKQKYKKYFNEYGKTIIDVRCPLACEIVKNMNITDIKFPNIEPILIHCAREVSTKYSFCSDEIIITTPCKSLADFGNSLNIKNIYFISWNKFLYQIKSQFRSKKQIFTPIPLGFFDSLDMKKYSISGEIQINNYFKSNKYKDLDIVEILFCDEGCHNGDGIV